MQVIISLGEGRTWNQGGSAEMKHYLLTCFHIIFVSRPISQPASHWRWLRVNVMYLNVNKQQVLFSTRCVCVNTLEQEACRSPHLAKNNEKSCREKPSSQWHERRKNSVNVALPVTFSERLAALPPWHHAPRRHLGLALDERVSSHLHQRLAPQLAVGEIWGNSWNKSSTLKLLFVKAPHLFSSKWSLIIYLTLRHIIFPPFSKISLWINSLVSMDNSH